MFSGHVVHYCLYLYDSRRDEPLESLDDIVYYIKVYNKYIDKYARKVLPLKCINSFLP